MMVNGKRGIPKGVTNNPKGINQYGAGKGTGEKDSRIQLVLSAEEKLVLKEVAQMSGMSLSSWIVEAALEAARDIKGNLLD